MSHDNPTDTRSQLERMQSGDLYTADDEELAAEQRHAYLLMREFDTQYAVSIEAGNKVLEKLLGSIGTNVQLLTPTHPVEPELRWKKLEAAKPIVIGDNVWIGSGAIVLAGVTVGENSVIGAGAVVMKDVPANVVVVGNPAKARQKIETLITNLDK